MDNQEQMTQFNQLQLELQLQALTKNIAKGLFSQGIVKGLTPEQLENYLRNPDTNQGILGDIADYYYLANGEVRSLIDTVESLPSMQHRIKVLEKDSDTENNLKTLNKYLHKINHKKLSRGIMKQVYAKGSVVGLWVGRGKKLSPFILPDASYYKVIKDLEGKLRIALDLNWFIHLDDSVRELYLTQLQGIIKASDFENFNDDPFGNKYVLVPIERSFVINHGVTSINQTTGSSGILPALQDIIHKKTLKDVERTVANKVINAVAVLTMGQNSKQGEKQRDYDDIPFKLITSIHNSVKQALSQGGTDGLSLVSIPNFTKLEFPDVKVDGLGDGKFKQTDSDIEKGLGLSPTILNGEGSNVGIANLHLDLFYRKLAIILEDIEYEVYNKLFNLLLKGTQKDNFFMEYDKERPLTLREKIEQQNKLNDKGWSSRHLIESIGFDFNEYLEQTVYENEVLKLNTQLLIPPRTSYTIASNVGNGQNVYDDPNGDLGTPTTTTEPTQPVEDIIEEETT